jgi:ABC-type transporter Mla MlaB component
VQTPGAHPVVLVIVPPIARSDIPRLCQQLQALVAGAVGAVLICDVGAVTDPDAVTVEALARLRLTARRLGRPFEIVGAGAALVDLVTLVGLHGLLLPPPPERAPPPAD